MLFQVCLAMHLRDMGHVVKIDTLGLENKFKDKVMFFLFKCGITLEECTKAERFICCHAVSTNRIKSKELKIIKLIFPKKLYLEQQWGEIPDDSYNYYFGYFQNINLAKKYCDFFQKGLDLIAEENSFVQPLSNDCFIHIRRGDYCTPSALALHGLMGEEYYNGAVKYFSEDMHFDVFSNDVSWVKSNLSISNIKVMEGEGFKYPDIEDLYKMSRHKYGIIANSTFSFWAALIGSSNINKEIVCPEKWFANEELQKLSYKIKNSDWVYK